MIEDFHGLLSGSPLENHVIEIEDTEDSMIIDLTINFPKNMIPLKINEKDDSNEPDNTKEKDDTMQKNKTEDKDDTNVIWERKKKSY